MNTSPKIHSGPFGGGISIPANPDKQIVLPIWLICGRKRYNCSRNTNGKVPKTVYRQNIILSFQFECFSVQNKLNFRQFWNRFTCNNILSSHYWRSTNRLVNFCRFLNRASQKASASIGNCFASTIAKFDISNRCSVHLELPVGFAGHWDVCDFT